MSVNTTQLSLATKLHYSVGQIGFQMLVSAISFYLMIFYTDVALVAPAVASSALLVGKIWDAVNDPLFGYMVDGTRSRHGRRRVYLIFGALPLAGLAAAVSGWDVSDKDAFIEDVRRALYASKVVAYSQGFDQIAAASAEYNWDIDRGAAARIWRGGCIIRAQFLNRITEAYEREADLALLISDPYFADVVNTGAASWRRVVSQAVLNGVPVPAFSSSLAYYDGVRAERLPAALIQAQRDFFGAHTYQRTDKEGVFHTEWSADRSETQQS